MNLNELRDEAYRIACEHGFHEEEHSDGHFIMLVITEISEAVEADRKGLRANHKDFAKSMVDEACFSPEAKKTLFQMNFAKYIKGSLEEELADVAIRLLDFAGLRDIDMSAVHEAPIREKEFIEQAFWICEMICLWRASFLKQAQVIPACFGVLLYIASRANIDLMEYVRIKMRYNSMREYKHGKKY